MLQTTSKLLRTLHFHIHPHFYRSSLLDEFLIHLFLFYFIFLAVFLFFSVCRWVIDKLEAAGFEVHTVETIGIHYSATIKRWYDNWNRPENVKYITTKYGSRWQRLWNWFLAWSVISPEQGSASCYQIVCHKNTSRFDRKQFIAERSQWKI